MRPRFGAVTGFDFGCVITYHIKFKLHDDVGFDFTYYFTFDVGYHFAFDVGCNLFFGVGLGNLNLERICVAMTTRPALNFQTFAQFCIKIKSESKSH
jgi:hypothetical protein